MVKNKKVLSVRDIAIVAILTAILFVMEQVLSVVPNVQLTVLLLMIFAKKLGILKSSIIILVHSFLDNLVSGSFNILIVIFMIIGWEFIPLLVNTLFKKVDSIILISLVGVLFSFLYSWIYMIPFCIIFEMSFFEYLKADIIWEVLLATSSFLSILLLYKPVEKIFDKFIVSE